MTTLLTVTTLAQDWGGHHDGDDWGWMVVMMSFMVLFWAVVIFGVVWLVRSWDRAPLAGGSKETPEQALDRSLADGTLSVEEYQRRRAVLAGEPAAGSSQGTAT